MSHFQIPVPLWIEVTRIIVNDWTSLLSLSSTCKKMRDIQTEMAETIIKTLLDRCRVREHYVVSFMKKGWYAKLRSMEYISDWYALRLCYQYDIEQGIKYFLSFVTNKEVRFIESIFSMNPKYVLTNLTPTERPWTTLFRKVRPFRDKDFIYCLMHMAEILDQILPCLLKRNGYSLIPFTSGNLEALRAFRLSIGSAYDTRLPDLSESVSESTLRLLWKVVPTPESSSVDRASLAISIRNRDAKLIQKVVSSISPSHHQHYFRYMIPPNTLDICKIMLDAIIDPTEGYFRRVLRRAITVRDVNLIRFLLSKIKFSHHMCLNLSIKDLPLMRSLEKEFLSAGITHVILRENDFCLYRGILPELIRLIEEHDNFEGEMLSISKLDNETIDDNVKSLIDGGNKTLSKMVVMTRKFDSQIQMLKREKVRWPDILDYVRQK